MTEEEVAARNEMRARLITLVTKSITGAQSPRAAAEFVVNSLTMHNTGELAHAAIVFARDQVEAMLL